MATAVAQVLNENTFRREEFPLPEAPADGALLEVTYTGICGTDMKILDGRTATPRPLVMGHEIMGRLVQVGEGLAGRTGLGPGDRVVLDATIPCWACHACQGGRYRFCRSKEIYGVTRSSSVPPHLWGGFASHVFVAPGSILHVVDEGVSDEAAALLGVFANGYEWVVRQGGVRPGHRVVIQGAGPQALACAVVAAEAGASWVLVTGLSRDRRRLRLIQELSGAEVLDVESESLTGHVREATAGDLADVVVDVSGSQVAIAEAPELVRAEGTLVVAGLTGDETETTLRLDRIVWQQIRLQGALGKGADSFVDAGRLLSRAGDKLGHAVTDVLPLDRVGDALALQRSGRTDPAMMKILIAP